ncbi:tetratricopeptide repeat protein, partial [archaeon]
LALCLDIKNHNPADGLTQAEMRPYVTRALDTPLNWMVYSTGLLIKSWLEFENHRTVERAVLQMQALVDQHTHRLTPLQFSRAVVDASAPARDRLAYVYALAFPSRWDLKRQCADRYRTLGVLRSALSLYEQLEMWDDIIQCHIALDKPKRATRLLRARLQAHPSPRLLCTLGEVTDDDAPILEAWNSSGRTYGRAQLLLGRRAFRRREYEAAVAAFRAGLALVPTSNRDWFLLGVLSMQLGQHEVALEAFSRVVQLEPQSADAWANIGSLYLRTKQWQRGYAALSQTLRMDSRDWRVWSNYLIACMHVRAYGRAIRTMHKLVDLRGRGAREEEDNSGVDVPCLGLLVQNVLASLEEEAAVAAARGDDAGDAPPPARKYVDMVGRPAALLLEDVAKLCGHIVSAVTKEAKVWQLYAKVQAARGRRADATDCRLRMCRALQSGGWEKEAD